MAITIRPKENQNFWNFTLSVLFLVILVVAIWEVWGEHGNFPRSIPLFDAVLMALATFRVTRLLVYDKITRWFRELFVKKETFEKNGVQWLEVQPYTNGLCGTISDLLGCPWCISFWSALVISFVYFMFPWAWILIFFLALAGVGSFVQLTANMIGWKAENLKLDAQEKEERAKRAIDLTSLGK